MNCQIVFTETAKSDLQEIAVSLAELSRDKNLAILQEQTGVLKQFPESGALPRDRVLRSIGFRFLVHKDYLLFYKYEKAEKRVYVVAVFNGKRDYMRVMKRFL